MGFRDGNEGGRPGRTWVKPPRLLRDMQWVYKHDEKAAETRGQRLCRQFLKDDPKGFLSKFTELEKAHEARLGRGEGDGETPVTTPPPTPAAGAIDDPVTRETLIPLTVARLKAFRAQAEATVAARGPPRKAGA